MYYGAYYVKDFKPIYAINVNLWQYVFFGFFLLFFWNLTVIADYKSMKIFNFFCLMFNKNVYFKLNLVINLSLFVQNIWKKTVFVCCMSGVQNYYKKSKKILCCGLGLTVSVWTVIEMWCCLLFCNLMDFM